MKLAEVLARIPFLAPLRLEVKADEEGVTVWMPDQELVNNHVGCLHAGALYTAAETAGGVAAWGIVSGDRAFVLLREARVNYTRRAVGSVLARATVEPAAAEATRETFEATSRADALVTVVIEDEAGERVFEGTFDYALRPRKR